VRLPSHRLLHRPSAPRWPHAAPRRARNYAIGGRTVTLLELSCDLVLVLTRVTDAAEALLRTRRETLVGADARTHPALPTQKRCRTHSQIPRTHLVHSAGINRTQCVAERR
jgi:hypothetical protein